VENRKPFTSSPGIKGKTKVNGRESQGEDGVEEGVRLIPSYAQKRGEKNVKRYCLDNDGA